MSKQQDQIVEAAREVIAEELLAVAFSKPRGATTAAAGGLIAGEIGARKAGEQAQAAEATGIALANPGAIAITPTSLVTMAVKVSFTGQIKEVTEVLSTVPLGAIEALEVKRMGMAGVMEITAGGSSFKLEGKVPDMRDVAEAFTSARAVAS